MAVCVLDKEETRRLENDGVRPNCCHHRHYPARDVDQLVKSGEMRWIVDGRRATENKPLVWAVVNSGGYDVLQMVDQ